MMLKALILTGVLLVVFTAYTEAVAVEDPTCPRHYDLTYYSGRCQCRCMSTNNCPRDYEWNSHECECVCVSDNYCSHNYVWDRNACKCVCQEKYCQANYHWDVNQCKCVCNSWGPCSSGYIWDRNTCSCKYSNWVLEEPIHIPH